MINEGFVVERVIGKRRPACVKREGVWCNRTSNTHHTTFVISKEAASRNGWTKGTQLALARLQNGRYALVQDSNGWKAGDHGSALSVVSTSFTTHKKQTAEYINGFWVFPEGAIVERAV